MNKLKNEWINKYIHFWRLIQTDTFAQEFAPPTFVGAGQKNREQKLFAIF